MVDLGGLTNFGIYLHQEIKAYDLLSKLTGQDLLIFIQELWIRV